MKKGISIVTVVVLVSTCFFSITFIPNAKAGTLYVGGIGPGNYTSIQSAIDAADGGNTVFVYSGTYYENLLISRSIQLIGENKDSTVVDAFGTGTVVNVGGGRAYIEGLTITGSGHGLGDAGIRVLSPGRLDVISSRISNSHYGIYISYSGSCTIADNLIHSNWLEGIYIGDSSRNIVSNNTIVDNGAGIIIGGTVSDNLITDNLIVSNGGGIWMGGLLGMSPFRNTVTGNTISDNGDGVVFYNAWDNTVTNNNLVGNDVQAFVRSDDRDWCISNQWDRNYWSDYNGTDSNGDGIGDTWYLIDCIDASGTHHYYDNYDPHPRMSPVGTIPIGALELNEAILSGDSLENLRLSWSVSPGNRSVIGFRVYRGSTYNAQGLDYGLTAFLPSDSSTFTDVGAGDGKPGTHFYRVCALDIFDDEICATDQGAKYARSLNQGPRLMSLPLIQTNESIEEALQTVKYDKAWYYDSSPQEWKWYTKSKGYRRGLWNVNHTMGIWVNVTQDSNLTVAGVVPAQTTIHLHEGWNLVSFPSFSTTYMVADLKAETVATKVEGYDSTPPYHLRVLGDAEVLMAGDAYWMRVLADTDWIVEVS